MKINITKLGIVLFFNILCGLFFSFSLWADVVVTRTEIEETDEVIEGTIDDTPSEIRLAWRKVEDPKNPGRLNEEIQDMAVGPTGSIWLATNRGLIQFSREKFRYFTRKNGLPHDQVFTLQATKRGILAGTKDGLVWLDDLVPQDQIVPLPLPNTTGSITSLFPEGEGFLFLRTRNFQESQISFLRITPDGTPEEKPSQTYSAPTRIRQFFPGEQSNQYYCQAPDRHWRACEFQDEKLILGEVISRLPLPWTQVGKEKIFLTRDRLKSLPFSIDSSESVLSPNRDKTKFWLGEKETLWLIQPKTGNVVKQFDLPQGMKIKKMVEEPNGRLWISTENKGIWMSNGAIKRSWQIPTWEFQWGQSVFDSLEEKPSIDELEASSQNFLPGITDFTSQGNVFSFEGARQIRLFEKDPTKTQKFWHQPEEIFLSHSLGNFTVTNRSGYRFSENNLKKVFTRKEEDFTKLEAIISTQLGEEWFFQLLSLPEIKKHLLETLGDREEELLQWGKQMSIREKYNFYQNYNLKINDYYVEITMNNFWNNRRTNGREQTERTLNFANIHNKLLVARKKDLVLENEFFQFFGAFLLHSLEEKPFLKSKLFSLQSIGAIFLEGKEVVFYFSEEKADKKIQTDAQKSKTTPIKKSIRLPQNPQLHNISLISHKTEPLQIALLLKQGGLYQMNQDFSLTRLSSPKNAISSLFYSSFSPSTTSLFALERKGLWQAQEKMSWVQKIQTLNPDFIIYGLLPENDGGVWVAGENLGTAPLLNISKNGEEMRTYLFDQFSLAEGDHPLIQDQKGEIWVGGNNGLYTRKTKEKIFTKFPGINTKIWGIVELVSGGLALGTGDEGVWLVKKEKEPEKIVNKGWNLSLFPVDQETSETIWINSITSLTSWEKGGKITNYSQKIQNLFGKKRFEIRDLERVQNSLLVATNKGLFKVTRENSDFLFQKVLLPGFPGTVVDIITILVRKNQKEVFISSYIGKGKSKIWKSSSKLDGFSLVTDVDFVVAALAETSKGEIIAGGKSPVIYKLGKGELVPYFVFPQIPPDLRSVALLGENKFLVLAGKQVEKIEGHIDLDNLDGLEELDYLKMRKKNQFYLYHVTIGQNQKVNKVENLLITTTPWKQSVVLSDQQVLLLYPDGAIAIFSQGRPSFLQKGILGEPFQQLAEINKEVYLLGKEDIWVYQREEGKVKKKVPLPLGRSDSFENYEFALDQKGVWFSDQETGLWRYNFSSSPQGESWTPFVEQDGLPSRKVEKVVPFSQTEEAVIFTDAGFVKVNQDQAGYWQFIPPEKRQEISGSQVNKILPFFLNDTLTLALGTEEGVTLIHVPGEDWENKQWRYLDKNSGLLDNEIQSLFWHAEKKELWVSSKEGIVVLPLNVNTEDLLEVGEISLTVTGNQGLSQGDIRDIKFGKKGKQVWLLSENALTRLEREEKEFTLTHQPFFLSKENKTIKLGPIVEGKSPSLLIRDQEHKWTVWDSSTVVRPHLSISERFSFGYEAQVSVESIDPAKEDLRQWDITYQFDGVTSLKSAWGWLPDLWEKTDPHYILVLLRPKDNPQTEYRVSSLIPQAHSQVYRWIRLGIVFFLLLVLLGVLAWYIRKLRIRARRLRKQEIPYIQGEAIQDGEHFFGRDKLLNKLKNTLPTTNYALVGEFRIGKTSIQIRLQDLLQSVDHPKYQFYPAFLDLQNLRTPREQHFFSFLGEHLLQLAKENEVSSEQLSQLLYQEGKDYDNTDFKEDLENLLEFLPKSKEEKSPVIVFQIDEISLMNDYEILLQLRAILGHRKGFKVVLSGRKLHKEEERDLVSPWWNLLTEIEVEPLTPSEGRNLIIEPVKGLFRYDEEAIEHIIGRAEGKPLAIQTICANLLHYKYQAEKFTTHITKQDLYDSIEFSKKNPLNHD